MHSSSQPARGFAYGAEIELLLVREADYEPLCYGELTADELFAIIAEIDTSGIGTDGMNVKPLHKGPSHYLVEGYTLTDEEFNPKALLPKGVEIRTPKCATVDEALLITSELHRRLRRQLHKHGMVPLVLSHHPTAPDCDAPRNYRRLDYWRWSQTVTTTYGPDVNISVPVDLERHITSEKLHGKVNYYAPVVVALSLNSPLYRGGLVDIDGKYVRSMRTYRRSIYAPLYYIHEKPQLRFELKGLEMAAALGDYKAYFLCALAILLDEKLTEQASDQRRTYELGRIAVEGLQIDSVRKSAEAVLLAAERVARRLGIDSDCLAEMHRRIEKSEVPADAVIELFRETGDVRETLKRLPKFEEAQEPACAWNQPS